MKDVNDNGTIEEMLVRSGDYLMERTAQYREQPVHTSTARQDPPPRYRRVLVGTAAAATLCVTALAGSFIGGSSSGKVDVAQAAWSAVPEGATFAQIENIKSSCAVDESYIAGLEGGTYDNFPQFLLEPSLVEWRGTTLLAVYFTFHHAIMCVQFEDRSVSKSSISMSWQSELWREPFALELYLNNETTVGTMIIGFLPGSGPISPADSAGQNDSSSKWVVNIDSPGVERVSASVQQHLKRFVAWIPGSVSGEVTFVNTATSEEGTSVKFDEPKFTKWNVSPITTVPSIDRPNSISQP